MGGVFANRSDFEIPTALINEYNWITDALIDGPTGKLCQLVFTPVDSECPNCYFSPETGHSTNMYRAGGPIPFTNFTTCPYCGGEGRRYEGQTENINLRVYTQPKDWLNIGVDIQNPNGVAQVIGYMNDLPKIEQATHIILDIDLEGIKRWTCQQLGDAMPWGLNNRYFVMFVKRGGGG